MGLLDKLEFDSNSDPEIDSEIGFEFAQDPQPNEAPPARSKPAKAAKPAPAKGSAAVAKLSKQVAADLASMIEIGAVIWGTQDDCCAPVLEQQARPIADALVGILGRNPRLLMAFANSDMAVMSMQSIALINALAPVGKAIYKNHISKAVDEEDAPHEHAVNLGKFPAFSSNGAGLARSYAT